MYRRKPSSRPPRRLLRALLAGAPLVLAFSPAGALELPQRKPGLWETLAVIDGKPRVARRCFKPGDRSAFLASVDVEACRKSAVRAGPGYLLIAECRVRDLKLTGRMQITGDFSSTLRGGVWSTVEQVGADEPPARTSMTFTSRRLGDCAR